MASRFGKENYDVFTEAQQSLKTKQATKFAVSVLKEFIDERSKETAENTPLDPTSITVEELNILLADFYANVRNKEGDIYSKSSLIAIRQGIRRYLQESPFDRDFDIINDTRFVKANNVFKSMLKHVRSEGKGVVKHKEPIHPGDMEMLYDHPVAMNPNTPQGLLNKTMFETLYYFCRRGRENPRDLDVSDFAIKSDPDGTEYVLKVTSEKTKNHQGTSNEDEGDGARMYATGGAMCPVKSFKKYIDKRNHRCTAYLQHPKASFSDDEDEWFENRAVGKNSLGTFMVNLSKCAGLSIKYTNQSIRATTITVLNNEGFKDRDIITVSGHRRTHSLSSYVADTTAQVKKQVSGSLSKITNASSSKTNITKCSKEISNDLPITLTGKNEMSVTQYPEFDLSSVDYRDCDDDELCRVLKDIENKTAVVQKTVKETENSVVYCAPNFNFNNCTVTIVNKQLSFVGF